MSTKETIEKVAGTMFPIVGSLIAEQYKDALGIWLWVVFGLSGLMLLWAWGFFGLLRRVLPPIVIGTWFKDFQPKKISAKYSVGSFLVLAIGAALFAIVMHPKAQPRNPLEVLGFDLDQKVTLHNITDKSIYVLDLEITAAAERRITTVAKTIGPRATESWQLDSASGFSSIDRLANLWRDHVRKAIDRYGQDCVKYDYFSENDQSWQMIRDFHAKNGGAVASDAATGIFHYRIESDEETKAQPIALVATTLVKKEGCKKTKQQR